MREEVEDLSEDLSGEGGYGRSNVGYKFLEEVGMGC